jgi:hypothetical protein
LRSWRSLLIAVLLTFANVALGADPAVAAPSVSHGGAAVKTVKKAPPAPPREKTGPLPEPDNHPVHNSLQPRMASPVDPIDLRVLVVSADGTEADLLAIQQVLNFLGTPYTVYIATQTPGGLTSAFLANGPHAFYQGVILTSGSLSYWDGTQYTSALTAAEWQNLWDFESAFSIRQVTWYTYPTSDYGFNAPNWSGDTTPPLPPVTTNFTAAGVPLFGGYANTANPVSISYAYTYKATPIADPANVPILQDGSGNALGLVKTYVNNRANLALTFDSNPNLVHTLQLAYGVVNWVTKGLFLGERHVYFDAQPDDLYIDNSTWPAGTPCGTSVDDPSLPVFRISDTDFEQLIAWQQLKRTGATTPNFRLEIPFNAYGTTGVYSPDTLTPYVAANQANFYWISHTWDHEDMNNMTYGQAVSEVSQNNTYGDATFGVYSHQSLITPNVSGLNNASVQQALFDQGVRYIVSDTSVPGWDNPSPNAGRYGVLQPAILIIPRHPTNLFFNVFQPADWVAEYNCIYRAFWGRDLTYPEILDTESTVMLGYLLLGDIDPLMFHQPNVKAYDGTHSLLGDLVDATLTKYERLFNLEVVSPTLNTIGTRMGNRMGYNASGVSASIIPGVSITISVTQTAVIPVTGLNSAGAETYGGQYISYITVNPGQPVTLPLT